MVIKRAARAILGPGHFDEVEVVRDAIGSAPGFMVDVGAHQGHAHRPFVDQGWRVLAIEPDPANRHWLEVDPHPDVEIVARAITDTDDQTLTLYTSPVSTGISTLAPFHDSHVAGTEVETARLDTLLAARGITHVDFLKVDTEGFDLPVLQTYPWSDDLPDVVVCEFEDSKTAGLGYGYRDLGDFLVEKGYDVLLSEWYPIVEYGTVHTWRRAIPYPADLVTPDAWGNFIATRPAYTHVVQRATLRAGRRLKLRLAVERALGRGPARP